MSGRQLSVVVAAIGLAFALGADTLAQAPVTATASVDRNIITIGDPIKLIITVEVEDGYRIAPLPQLAKFGELTVLDTLPVLQGTPLRGVTRYQFRYFVTTFDLGDHLVPTFEFEYSSPDGLLDHVRTTPLAIRVRSVIQPGEDASDIKPLKPQLDVPGAEGSRLRYWAALGAAAVILAIVAFFIARALRRRWAPVPAIDAASTPVQQAIAELRRIAALDLPAKGRREEHYELVAKAIRRYLGDRYGIPAQHRTARELYRDMESAGVEPRQATAMHEILRESEAVRFQRAARHPRHAQEAVAAALAALAKAAAAERPEVEVAS